MILFFLRLLIIENIIKFIFIQGISSIPEIPSFSLAVAQAGQWVS